jgi:hypothetical protein
VLPLASTLLALAASPFGDDAPAPAEASAPHAERAAGAEPGGPHAALWPGFIDEIEVRGARPPREVKGALRALLPALAGCVRRQGAERADLMLSFEVLAAGFVDRITTLHHGGAPGAIDEGCARAALRMLPAKDRGREPVSHVVVRLAAGPGGGPPPPGLGPRDIALAFEVRRDDVARCIEEARKKSPELAGTVVVRLTVQGSGDVQEVDAREGTLPSPAARACIAESLRHVRFRGGRSVDERIAWPLRIDKPPPPGDARSTKTWDAPTLFSFLGCGGL